MTDESSAKNETEFWERRHDLTPQATTDADIETQAENGSCHLVLFTNSTDEAILSQFESVVTTLDGSTVSI
jgi:hypothetical protein